MQKYRVRQMAAALFIYALLFIAFGGFAAGSDNFTERLMHQDSNLSLIVLISDCILIAGQMPDRNEIYRFNRFEKYLHFKFKSFARFSLVYHFLLFLIDAAVLVYKNTSVGMISLICQTHLWLISTVLYMLLFILNADGKSGWLIWTAMIAVCLSNIAASNHLFVLRGMSLFQLYFAADCTLISGLRYILWFILICALAEIKKGSEL